MPLLRRLISLLLLVSTPAHAGLIRDAEVEATLQEQSNPIFKSAGLKPSAIQIFIVQDNSLNAFVAGGQNLFIHTGLIMQTKTPDMLLGVIAHETGHIAGGHLAKGSEKLKNVQLGTLVATLLGGAAAAATGRIDAAAAVIVGTNNSAQRNFFAFTRDNENAADQAALGYLDRLGISASGMLDVFAMLKQQERQHFGKPDPYLMTHPLTNDRIEVVQAHVNQSSITKGAYPPSLREKHERMVAKLFAFLNTPQRTLQQYPARDESVAARMARAIAYFREAKMEESMALMDTLIKERPNDPYLYDLKGQMLFESSRVEPAYAAYQSAAKLLPNEPLILVELGKVELARNTPADTKSAVAHLERATSRDPSNSLAWHLLATAYGKQSNQPMANLALAEKALSTGDVKEALTQSNRAINGLKPASPSYLRAQDLRTRALQMKKEQDDAESGF